MTLIDRIQSAVIRTSPYPPFRWVYAMTYGAILLWLMIRVRRIPEIRRLELRAPRKGHRFGVSDLDVRAETSRLSTAQFFLLCDRLADFLRPASRAMRILDFYVFGPDEAQLQLRLGPISFGDARLIRLLGPKVIPVSNPQPAPRAPRNAILCRSMYEFGYLSQELFGEDPSLPLTWKVLRRFARIDDGFGVQSRSVDPECAPIRDRMRARADCVASGGKLKELGASDVQELFGLALGEVDAIARMTVYQSAPHDSIFRPCEKSIAPDTLPDAIASCSAQVVELCSQLSAIVQSAILGCVPASGFDYRLYLIVRDDLPMSERTEVFRAIRAMYAAKSKLPHIRSTYLRLTYPLVLTPAMWRASPHWYHALRPVEECFFIARHGVVLCGIDPRATLAPPSAIDLIRSAAIATADLRNLIWSAVHGNQPRRLVDVLLGRVPALWLMLTRSIIATSSGEAIAGCAAAGLRNVSLLEDLQAGLGTMKPEKLPATDDSLWKPALDASSEWIDEIARTALVRLTAYSEDSQPAGPLQGAGF